MKFYANLLIAGIAVLLGCDDGQSISDVPQISFIEHYLELSDDVYDLDKYVIKFDYTDGGNNLGLDDNRREHQDPPYHYMNYFLIENATTESVGHTVSLVNHPEFGYSEFKVVQPENNTGILATVRTLRELGVTNAPAYSPNSCKYRIDTVYVPENIIDDKFHILDVTSTPEMHYLVADTFYCEPNKNYNNLFIQFWKEDQDGSFSPVDFGPLCLEPFFLRIPDLPSSPKQIKDDWLVIDMKTRDKGTITVTLPSNTLRQTLLVQKFKVTVHIQDRELNESNIMETTVGTMESIIR